MSFSNGGFVSGGAPNWPLRVNFLFMFTGSEAAWIQQSGSWAMGKGPDYHTFGSPYPTEFGVGTTSVSYTVTGSGSDGIISGYWSGIPHPSIDTAYGIVIIDGD